MIKYFHQLRYEEFLWLIAEGTTWDELRASFPPPPWCKEPDVLHPLGCWSLLTFDNGRCRVNEEFCRQCEMYKG